MSNDSPKYLYTRAKLLYETSEMPKSKSLNFFDKGYFGISITPCLDDQRRERNEECLLMLIRRDRFNPKFPSTTLKQEEQDFLPRFDGKD